MSSWKTFNSSRSYKTEVRENNRSRNTVPLTPADTVENDFPDSLQFDQLKNEANPGEFFLETDGNEADETVEDFIESYCDDISGAPEIQSDGTSARFHFSDV